MVPFVASQLDPFLKDPSSFLNPLQKVVSNNLALAAQRRRYYQDHPDEALSVLCLLAPFRILKILLSCMVLAEVVGISGILDEDEPTIAASVASSSKRTAKTLQTRWSRFWKTTGKPHMEEWNTGFRNWCTQARQSGGLLRLSTWQHPRKVWKAIQELPQRYQFAVGAAFGMIASPIGWAIGKSLLKTGLVVYVISELNQSQ